MANLASDRDDWSGRSRRRLRHWVLVALVLFVVAFGLHTPAIAGVVHPLGIPTGFRVNIGVFALLVAFPAALVGYLDDGLAVAVLLAAGVAFGGFLPSALFDSPAFPVPLGPVLRTALVVTVLAGGVGFLAGAGLRRLVT